MAICSRNIKLKEISAISIISNIIIVISFISGSLFTINIICFSSSPAPQKLSVILNFSIINPIAGLVSQKDRCLPLSSPSSHSISQIFREILNCSIMKPVYLKGRRAASVGSIQFRQKRYLLHPHLIHHYDELHQHHPLIILLLIITSQLRIQCLLDQLKPDKTEARSNATHICLMSSSYSA